MNTEISHNKVVLGRVSRVENSDIFRATYVANGQNVDLGLFRDQTRAISEIRKTHTFFNAEVKAGRA